MKQEIRSFVETLKDIRHGDVIGDLTVNLLDVVTAVRATGGTGVLTLQIKVKPFSKGDLSTLAITDDVKIKLPRAEKGVSVLFADDRNQLTRTDPRQPELSGLRQPATVRPLRSTDRDDRDVPEKDVAHNE